MAWLAGFDWKIIGPDVGDEEYVAWQCDQDAYAYSGQKCSATSILFLHQNWVESGIEATLADLAARRQVGGLCQYTFHDSTTSAHYFPFMRTSCHPLIPAYLYCIPTKKRPTYPPPHVHPACSFPT